MDIKYDNDKMVIDVDRADLYWAEKECEQRTKYRVDETLKVAFARASAAQVVIHIYIYIYITPSTSAVAYRLILLHLSFSCRCVLLLSLLYPYGVA